MNCPRCGGPLSQFRCSKCGFDIREDSLFFIGNSSDQRIPLLEQYIRQENAKQQPLPEEPAPSPEDLSPIPVPLPLTPPTKELKNPFSWEVSTIKWGSGGTYIGDAKGMKPHGLGIVYDINGNGTISVWRDGHVDQKLTEFRNSMQEEVYMVFGREFWDAFDLSNLHLEEKNALERQMNANYNTYIKTETELGIDSVTETDALASFVATQNYVDALLRDWIFQVGRFLPKESEIRAGKFMPSLPGEPAPKGKSKILPIIILIAIIIAIVAVVFGFIKSRDGNDLENRTPPPSSPDSVGSAISDEYQYYSDCLDELNSGLSTGAYKQVLSTKDCIYCLNSDGTITVFGNQYSEKDTLKVDYSSWSDVAHIEVLYDGSLVGLKSDGHVLMDESAFHGKADVSDWEDIVSINGVDSEVLFGLTADGTVHYTPAELPSGDLEDINSFITQAELENGCKQIALCIGKGVIIVGLSANGTIVQMYDDRDIYYHGTWVHRLDLLPNLVSISVCSDPGANDLFGLTDEGKAVYIGCLTSYNFISEYEENIISTWENISAIDTGGWHFVALKDDGTVSAVGDNKYGQCDVNDWTDIVRIEAYYNTTVGYASNGTIRMAGHNSLEEHLSNLQSTSSPSGWGDSSDGRRGYTLDEINHGALGDRIIFNVLSDSTESPIGGDERNFVGAREVNSEDIWNANRIEAKDKQKFYVRAYIDPCNPNGMDAISRNTRVAFGIPMESGTELVINGFIFSDNGVPSEYWDSIVFYSDTPFHFEYEYGSALLENNGIGSNGGVALGDEIVTKAASQNGVAIGYDALDGNIPGGSTYDCFVTFRVTTVFDS